MMTKTISTSQITTLLALTLVAAVFWYIPAPVGVTENGWHLLGIFLATIGGIILNPFPMGAISLFGIMAAVLTKTLTLDQCLAGFGSDIVWLVVFAFFISQGFVKTGLGSRIAYFFISKLGRSTLGLSYGLVVAEFILSPLIPSVTARGGGIIYPIAHSLAESYQDKSHKGVSVKTAGFIMQACAQSNVITSSMFITAMAANPLIVKLAKDAGIAISWTDWALAAFVPGVLSLILMPLVLFKLYKPEITHSETAPQMALKKLQEMGSMKLQEIIMLFTFFILISLWIAGGKFGISATTTALIGFCLLMVTGVLKWDDAAADKAAWHTFTWFATLVMMSGFLSKLGMMGWIGEQIKELLAGQNPQVTAVVVMLIYFYIHYLFASITAHVTVLFPTFLLVLIGTGVPATLAALVLGFASILSGGLTHFGIASAPIFFGAGYMNTKTWWKLGGIMSLLYIAVWTIAGGAWWKVLGLY
jgi:divalent anion:Na+ symporter, DASS family